ncbi:MAG TPA: OmpA family protein [Acetobacteraceae bacterium]|jgi:outer membrane protein OmpA-like peptidoglycan-associated protein
MHRLGLAFLLLIAAIGTPRAADLPGQKFVVFFQEWSAAIDDSAQAVITQAADWVKSHPGNVAHVNGFASTVGGRQANILLADLRAQVVVDQLMSDGVGPARIRQRGHGPVPFALTAQESRRVEISISRH